MYSTPVYLYQQKQQVLLPATDGSYFQRRWQPVYAKKLKVNRGVDNVILFEFINQDQKPVNIIRQYYYLPYDEYRRRRVTNSKGS